MNRLIKAAVALCAAVLMLDAPSLLAQNAGGRGGRQRNQDAQGNDNQGPGNRGNRGNFDPAQMQERMMERMKETLNVTSDDEWKVIQDRLQKVMEAQRETRSGGGGFGMMMGNRRGGGPGGNNTQDTNNNNRQQRRGGNPAATELVQALDDNASADTVAAKLEAFRAARKAAEAKLEAAQSDLQKVVTRKQEARLVVMGYLK